MNARRGVAVGGLMLAAVTLVGCAGGTPTPVAQATAPATPPVTAQPVTTPTVTTPPAGTTPATTAVTAPSDTADDSHRGGGSRHGGASSGDARTGPAALPTDWPDLPLPPGTLDGATGAGGSWTVRLQTVGSADVVRRRTETFYVAQGFARTGTADVLVRGLLRLVVVTENRDHSATSTVLVLGLTRS
jgi:hypothetical protein